MNIAKIEELREKHQNGDEKKCSKPPSEFFVFVENRKYFYKKFFPHLNTIEKNKIMLEDFRQAKMNEKSSRV